jgi:hypothetical protein
MQRVQGELKVHPDANGLVFGDPHSISINVGLSPGLCDGRLPLLIGR